ncbi:hypothetical protein [Nocardioides jishulii]|uniref:Tetratricopeptide repeat protein n=1 Tax=Nocardioides jishulii TaxID=2575440 RepID=A0A4U2YK66_9ACTN|nr:hypothetical protein [Nocardioides jishulii]QCX28231.1 hypothetical protein FCL41_12400 [Nocardioides jishulii]TKI60895.1 hypothetical protein FC770_15470 [Nocardioides jishulii]
MSPDVPDRTPRRLDDPVRARTRRRVVRGAVATVAAATVVLGHLAALTGSAFVGERHWREGDHAAAESWFRVSDRIDVLERWKAPYDVGVAVMAQGRWLEAADLFARARRTVPAYALCRVALNESLALETLGDELAEADDQAGARSRWSQAQQVLAEAEGCSAEQGESGNGEAEESDSASDSDSDSESGSDADSDADAEDGEDGDGSEDGEPGEGEGSDSEGSEGDGEGEGQGDAAEGPGSQADQLEEAARRLEQKLDGTPTRDGQPQEADSPEDKASELAERTSGAARRRSSEQDSSAPTQGKTSDRPTW